MKREEEKKKKRETREKKEKERKRDQENKRKKKSKRKSKRKRTREKWKTEKNHKTQKNHRTNCHIMIRKKKNRQTELFGIFSSKVQNITPFSIDSMIRIRFSGSRELNWKAFSGEQSSSRVAAYARNFPKGHRSFFGPGFEEKLHAALAKKNGAQSLKERALLSRRALKKQGRRKDNDT